MIVLVPKIWYAWDAILAYASYRTYVRLVLPAMPSTYHTMFQKEKEKNSILIFNWFLGFNWYFDITFHDNFWFDFTVIWRFNDENLLNTNMYCKILFFLTRRISLELLWSKDFAAKTLNVQVHMHQLLLTKIILLQIMWDELLLSLTFGL